MATIQAFNAIRAFIRANWPDVAPRDCPLEWDNEPITPPQPYGPIDPSTNQPVVNAWGRVLIDGDLWGQASIGTGSPDTDRWEETGSLMLFVFAPVGTGSELTRELLTAFAEMCRGQDIGAVEFQDIRFDPIGVKDDTGSWWGMHIVIDWKRG
ncbi:hypothetical protein AZL_020400 [Azospirillum sp. B510]|uniref:hypothetical protein n=1 Tax=Azospirillum sp. (strain B510) TaxID=137722 RepID=UPI0001C4C358|nr:hypothetical protein [Azospirillum sp. B510]BAI71473.1 hypothetical protein AZL_008350 [Azospirillum sp. B510]BAI72678.1 hypothetical protein AZL_020400 [Azospirillum sp. B510]